MRAQFSDQILWGEVMIKNVYTVGLSLVFSLGTASAVCDIAATFMPDGTRTYQMTTAQGKETITSKTKAQGDQVVVQSSLGGQNSTTTWICTKGGLSAKLGGQISMNTGTLPPLSLWRPGYTWVSEGDMGGPLNMHLTTRYTIIKQEQVTTPAGTFTAYRVDGLTTTKLNVPAGTKLPSGMAALNGQQTKATTWFARGVGGVKTVSPSFTMTLTKYSR